MQVGRMLVRDKVILVSTCLYYLHHFKGIYLSKALTCMKYFLYVQKLLFISRSQIPLATLSYEQFIHLT